MKINDKTNLKDGNIEIKNGQIIYNFNSNKIIPNEDALKLCYYFGVGMNGNHNNDKIQHRMVWEIFRDDFRGKYSEIEVRNNIIQNLREPYSIITDLDFKIEPLGSWDTTDLDIKHKDSENNYESISVKGIKKGSSNLLIEKDRFNNDGSFSYKNKNKKDIKVDVHVLVEVDIEEKLDKYIYKDCNGNYDTDNTEGEFLDYDKVIDKREVTPKILGAISHDYFWKIKAFAPKGIICSSTNLYNIYKDKHIYNENNINEYLNLPEYYTDENGDRCFYKEGAIAHTAIWRNGKPTEETKVERNAEKNYQLSLKQNNYFVTKYQLKPLKKVLYLKEQYRNNRGNKNS